MRRATAVLVLALGCGGGSETGGGRAHEPVESTGASIAVGVDRPSETPPAAAADGPTDAPSEASEPSAPHETDRLAVARILDTPTLAYLRDGGARVFGWGWESASPSYPDGRRALVSLDPTGAAAPVLGPYPSPSLDAAPEYTDAVVAGHLLTIAGEDLVVVDPALGAARWRAPLPIPASVTRRQHPFVTTRFVRAGEVLVGSVGDTILESWGALVAYDWADGRVRWSRDAPPVIPEASSATHVFARAGGHSVVAIDAATGRQTWSRSLGPGDWSGLERVEHDEGAVVVETTGALVAIDAETGRIRRRVPLAPRSLDTLVHPPTVSGGVAYVSLVDRVWDDSSTPRQVVLAAIALETGRVLWETAPLTSTWRSSAPIVVDADSVVTCLDDEAVRAFDRRTGASLGELGLGGHCELVGSAPDGEGHRAIVARRGDALVVLEHGDVAPPPLASVVLHGTVTHEGSPVRGAVVMAGGASTTTDRAGHWELRLSFRGVLPVEAWTPTAERSVRMEVAADVEQTVDLAIVGPGPVD